MLDLDILRVKLDLTLEAETAESYKSWYTKNRLKNYLNGLGSENLEKNEISVNSFNELITRFPKNEYQYQIQTICIQPMNFNFGLLPHLTEMKKKNKKEILGNQAEEAVIEWIRKNRIRKLIRF